MPDNRLTLRQFFARYDAGGFSASIQDQCEAGWYDWLCKDSTLSGRLGSLVPKLRQVLKADGERRINLDTNYVWFKNCSPFRGKMYDMFGISDIASEDVLFSVVPASGHDSIKGKSVLYALGKDGSFQELLSGSWDDVIAYFKEE